MNKLIFLIGLPGSGKTTYAKNNLTGCKILSSDDIRKELLGDENCQLDNKLIFSTLYERAKIYLQNGCDVVIDATNVKFGERQKALNEFKTFSIKRIAIVMNTKIEECIKRDKNRERTVGESVIYKFKKIFSKPTKKEGFDEIVYICEEEK